MQHKRSEALTIGCNTLKKAGIQNQYLDASILLSHVLNINRSSLIATGIEPLPENDFQTFCLLIKRRKEGECTAYITEQKEFWGLNFYVDKRVLVPRPETETLIEAAIQKIKEKRKEKKIKVLDLCTGSGAVAIALKHEIPQLELYATDISSEALEVAKLNAARLLLPDNNIAFLQGDLYNALPAPHSSFLRSAGAIPHSAFDIIVSNPPYVPSGAIPSLSAEVRCEPRLALDGGHDGLEIIKRIIDKAPDNLNKGGVILLEADPRQMKTITSLLDKRGFSSLMVHNDLSWQQRVIGGFLET